MLEPDADRDGMEQANLNEIMTHLRRANEEALRGRVRPNVDPRAYEELKAQYAAKARELDEATCKIEHLKRLCRVLEEKLGRFFTAHSENQKLGNRVRKLQRKLEATCRDNRAYLSELEGLRAMLENATSADANVAKVVELQRSLREKEAEYAESLDKVRSDATRSLLTLEAKIVTKIKSECTQEGITLTDEIKKKLADNECIIEALNLSNLRLKEKLELKESQYQELENSYVHLRVSSQQQLRRGPAFKANHMYGDTRTDSSHKTLASKNIDDVLKEMTNLSPPADSGIKLSDGSSADKSVRSDTQNDVNSLVLHSGRSDEAKTDNFVLMRDGGLRRRRSRHYYDIMKEIFVGNRADDEQDSGELTDDSCDNTEELLSIRNVGFEDVSQPFKIDIKENEISVEVKPCELKNDPFGNALELKLNGSRTSLMRTSHRSIK